MHDQTETQFPGRFADRVSHFSCRGRGARGRIDTMNGCPRYTQIKFPPYRFIPGENPHPTENPCGHSYGKKGLDIGLFVPADWRKNEQYLFGIDLYNYGYWWESHE